MKVKIAHIGIYTTDLERMKNFYVKYFDAVSGPKYEEEAGFSSYFLTLGSDVRLEIMSHTQLEYRTTQDKVNGLSHIAFSAGNKGKVILLTNRLSADGYKIISPAQETGDGYFESKLSDPDGNMIEITE